jgi:hypothetical protein
MNCLLQATGRGNSATALADLRGDGGCPFYISAQIRGRGRNHDRGSDQNTSMVLT